MGAALIATNLPAGGAVLLETSSLPGGALALSAVDPGGYLRLTDAKSDVGVALTATATGGAMGVARTAGTSLTLVGEATSASAKTDKAMWEIVLPNTYTPGAVIPVTVNTNYTTSGTVTAASTTMTLNAYTESAAGVEAAISGVTAAQEITATAAGLLFNVPGTGLTAGARLVLELVMLVTTSAGAATGQVNSVSVAV